MLGDKPAKPHSSAKVSVSPLRSTDVPCHVAGGSSEADVSGEEKIVLDCILDDPVHIDEISRMAGRPVSTVLTVLSMLEIKGLVGQMPGKHFVRT